MEITQITEIHSLAKILPDMGGSEFANLKSDVKMRGLLEPIWTYEGKVLDGRHRFQACQETGIEPTFREYKGSDPVSFVISLNINRRHLDTSQRAMVGARIANLEHGQKKGDAENSVSQPEAAKTVNVSIDSIQFAKKVINKGTPELIKARKARKRRRNETVEI